MAPGGHTAASLGQTLFVHHAVCFGQEPAGLTRLLGLKDGQGSHLVIPQARGLESRLLHGSSIQAEGQDGLIGTGHHCHWMEDIGGEAALWKILFGQFKGCARIPEL